VCISYNGMQSARHHWTMPSTLARALDGNLRYFMMMRCSAFSHTIYPGGFPPVIWDIRSMERGYLAQNQATEIGSVVGQLENLYYLDLVRWCLEWWRGGYCCLCVCMLIVYRPKTI
jgi:hypothetical protein